MFDIVINIIYLCDIIINFNFAYYDKKENLLVGREEIEIRSATIWGVELIRQQFKNYNAAEIDNALWLMSQSFSKDTKPYHRTYTIYY